MASSLLIIFADDASLGTAVILVIIFFVGSFSFVLYNVNQVSLRQAITPDRLLGRMNASMRFLVWGTIPIGSLIGGFLGDAIGLRPTIILSAVLGVAVVPVGLFLARAPLEGNSCPGTAYKAASV